MATNAGGKICMVCQERTVVRGTSPFCKECEQSISQPGQIISIPDAPAPYSYEFTIDGQPRKVTCASLHELVKVMRAVDPELEAGFQKVEKEWWQAQCKADADQFKQEQAQRDRAARLHAEHPRSDREKPWHGTFRAKLTDGSFALRATTWYIVSEDRVVLGTASRSAAKILPEQADEIVVDTSLSEMHHTWLANNRARLEFRGDRLVLVLVPAPSRKQDEAAGCDWANPRLAATGTNANGETLPEFVIYSTDDVPIGMAYASSFTADVCERLRSGNARLVKDGNITIVSVEPKLEQSGEPVSFEKLLPFNAKKCRKCQWTKPPREFRLNSQTADGLHTECWACTGVLTQTLEPDADTPHLVGGEDK